MPLYDYKALNMEGKRLSDSIEAGSVDEAKSILRDRDLMIVAISEKKTRSGKGGLTGDQLVTFTTLLSQLVDANVPLYESLLSLEEQYRGEKFHHVIVGLCDAIKGGGSVSEAMKNYPESFDKLYCAMVAAGEVSGALSEVLNRLAKYLARRQEMKKNIVTAMIYPAILGCFALVVVSMLLLFVVPSIEAIFEGRELNGFTRVVLAVSHGARGFWWLILPLVIGLFATAFVRLRTDVGQKWLQKVLLRLPIIRKLTIEAAVGRFSRTMGTMLEGGVTMIEAMRVSRTIMNNCVLEEEMVLAEEHVIQGSSLSLELARSKWMPQMVSRMVAIGEDSGTTPAMFNKIADIYDDALSKALERAMALVQPAILLLMGVVIGAILLAILLPLTDVGSFAAG